MRRELEQRLAQLFDELCTLAPEEQSRRMALLARDEPELEAPLRRLLAADREGGAFLERPALGALAFAHLLGSGESLPEGMQEHELPVPEAIGPYRILGRIGAGGMGIVYRAEQQRPRRVVALKVLKSELADARAYRDFDREARALARLEHPGIARIHDAGMAEFGQGAVPYLVMELVEGLDLASYAREHRIGRRERARLMVELCEAVHYAHQKSVIHRDLKPRNVLVTAEGRIKVLDFGLARIGDEERSRDLSRGDSGRILGTLAYMAPEQLGGDPDAVDAASDVYSLGATAFELLAGATPYDLQGLALPGALHRVAQGQARSARELAPELDRDLAAVLDKAIRRERSARYHSAAGLAEDLERWIRGDPVGARPIGRWEACRHFARRHRVLLGAAAVLVLALAVGVVAVSWQAHRAWLQADRSARILGYLVDGLRFASSPRLDGRERPMSDMLDEASHRLEQALGEDPHVYEEVARTLGNAYFAIGEYAKADRLLRATLERRLRRFPADAPEVLESWHDHALVLLAQGHEPEAEAAMRDAYEGRLSSLGERAEATQESANWLGQILLRRNEVQEAEVLFARSVAIRRDTLGERALPTLTASENLALAWRRLGRLQEAEGALRAIVERLGEDPRAETFELYEAENNLAALLIDSGRPEESRRLLEHALAGYRRLRGAEHPDTRLVASNLALVEADGSPPLTAAPTGESAATPLAQVLRIRSAHEACQHGRIDDAERMLDQAIAGLLELGGQASLLAKAYVCLANVRIEQGRLDEASLWLDCVLEDYAIAGVSSGVDSLVALSSSAECLRRQGRLQAALERATEAWIGLQALHGSGGMLYWCGASTNLAAVLCDLGRLEEAERLAGEALALAEARTPELFDYLPELSRVRLGRIHARQGRYEQSEGELLLAYERLAARHGRRGTTTQRAVEAIVALYEAWERPAELSVWRAPPIAPAVLVAGQPLGSWRAIEASSATDPTVEEE